tara:strand:- start:45 stop:626 length:582 start_codon:yes stop_codon:yes gene_type:complete
MSVDAWNWKYYTWTNVFNKNEVKQICEFIENNYVKLEGPELGAHDKDGNYKKQISSVKVIHYETIEPLISRLIKLAFQVANLDFGYITFGPHPRDSLLYNTYHSENKDCYNWHYDESRSPLSDVKLTLLVNLSTEPYEGGEFEMYLDSETSDSRFDKPGSAIMFKSHFNHRVLPVTSGIRKSLAMFITGPRFR